MEMTMDFLKIREFLLRPPILVCLALSRIEKNKGDILTRLNEIYCIDKRFRIAKVVGYITLLYGTEKQKNRLLWYRFGVYPIYLERALNILIEKGIISEDNNRFFLTAKGLSWLSKRVEHVKDNTTYETVLNEIDQCLFTPMPDLITKMAKLSPNLNYSERPIGGKKICRVFEWKNFGKGIIEPYHYTLLLSYSYSEKYFEEEYYSETKRVSEKGMSTSPRFVDYEKIPDMIKSNNLEKQRKKFADELSPLVHIFDKKDPSYLTQIKIEAKNYVANLWYVVESINIVHALSGLCPTCDEIARVCLTNYLVDVEGYATGTIDIRRMRERIIKNDVMRLFEHGILTREKWEKTYVYQIAAKSFYDVLLEKKYEVLSKVLAKDQYEKRIRPYRMDFRDPFGVGDKILYKNEEEWTYE